MTNNATLIVEPQPIWHVLMRKLLISTFFFSLLVFYYNPMQECFRWSNSTLVVWSPQDLLQVNFFSVLDPPLKTLLLFLSFSTSMNKLNRSETKNWNFSLIFLITICQFRNWFQSFINTIFLQEKSSRWSSFWPFCLLLRSTFWRQGQDRVPICSKISHKKESWIALNCQTSLFKRWWWFLKLRL